ncbi:hypothetical protein BT69DRAFT_987795 [Atractiella rhizophila]|nr:hypothetical protein BT69DRAFT_987795 [Atractiella rhizophila]
MATCCITSTIADIEFSRTVEVPRYSCSSRYRVAKSPKTNIIVEMQCEYCDKCYKGRNARSIYKRHLAEKHSIPLNSQARKTRWDNNPNRPSTAEERRERTLESKRRWARENRERKKKLQAVNEVEFEDETYVDDLLSPTATYEHDHYGSSQKHSDGVPANSRPTSRHHSHEETEAAAVLFGLSSEAGPVPQARKKASRASTRIPKRLSNIDSGISVQTASGSSSGGKRVVTAGNKRKRTSVSSRHSPLNEWPYDDHDDNESPLRSPLILDHPSTSLQIDPQLLEDQSSPAARTEDEGVEISSDRGGNRGLLLPSSTPRPSQSFRNPGRKRLLPPGDSSPPEMPEALDDSSPSLHMHTGSHRTRSFILAQPSTDDTSLLQTPPPPTFGLDRHVLGIPSSIGPGEDPMRILGIGRKIPYMPNPLSSSPV